jgi:hypothetical protein
MEEAVRSIFKFEYRTVYGATPQILDERVNRAIEEEWNLYGNLSFSVNYLGGVFFQAMIRGVEEEAVDG